jgi:hypothetical protein
VGLTHAPENAFDLIFRLSGPPGDALNPLVVTTVAQCTSYYTGINAASLSVLLGDVVGARRVASDVIALCKKEAAENDKGAAPDAGQYWLLATIGECALDQCRFGEVCRRSDARLCSGAAAV